jgi:hypothetical protein
MVLLRTLRIVSSGFSSIDHQEDRAAVDAAGKAHADRLGCGNRQQPLLDFYVQCADVPPPDFGNVSGKGFARGCEETPIGRVGIGATDQLDFREMVCGNHARVAGMKLISEPAFVEPRLDRVDAMRHDQCGPVMLNLG